jgi:hypothetical protein
VVKSVSGTVRRRRATESVAGFSFVSQNINNKIILQPLGERYDTPI